MICEYCGGNVIWMGRITNLTHTQCQKCGGTNCQLPEITEDAETDETENQHHQRHTLNQTLALGLDLRIVPNEKS